ncbi:MAG: hypothetical protein V2J26_12390 [Pacificimonas sp.]|jgi:uncharacterized membrane protein|nr:hypothetical protein [Pacificimonas sp.]
MIRPAAAIPPALLLAACSDAAPPSDGGPDLVTDEGGITRPFAGIAADEVVSFGGTEPFWSVTLSGDTATYRTPELPAGEAIAVTRFAGRGGVSWTGEYAGRRFALTATPGLCSDGMSDRTYPYFTLAEVDGRTLEGCAHTDRQPFTGPAAP